jgi:spore maturation protein A
VNVLFTVLIFASVIALIFVNPASVMPAMMGGMEAGAHFALRLFVIYAIWLSVLKILQKSGADKAIGKALAPAMKKLFKGESAETNTFLSMNMSANLLGMGGAATPMGLRAMETMQSRKNKIMLVVVNSCSIQLIPTTVLALRSGYGAARDIMLPALIVNVIITVIGVILVKVFVRDKK